MNTVAAWLAVWVLSLGLVLPGSSVAQGSPSLAREAQPLAADPALEARVMAIAEELRCLVCQNETLAASHAELAVDLRGQIRRQLVQGLSQPQILDYMVQRYGDFVLYRPPFKATTVLLWVGPFVLLAMALLALARTIARRRREGPPKPISAADLRRAQRLLEEPGVALVSGDATRAGRTP